MEIYDLFTEMHNLWFKKSIMFNFLLEAFDIMLYDHLFMFNDDACRP